MVRAIRADDPEGGAEQRMLLWRAAKRTAFVGFRGRQRQTQSATFPKTLTDLFQVDLIGAVIAEKFDLPNVPLLSGVLLEVCV